MSSIRKEIPPPGIVERELPLKDLKVAKNQAVGNCNYKALLFSR